MDRRLLVAALAAVIVLAAVAYLMQAKNPWGMLSTSTPSPTIVSQPTKDTSTPDDQGGKSSNMGAGQQTPANFSITQTMPPNPAGSGGQIGMTPPTPFNNPQGMPPGNGVGGPGGVNNPQGMPPGNGVGGPGGVNNLPGMPPGNGAGGPGGVNPPMPQDPSKALPPGSIPGGINPQGPGTGPMSNPTSPLGMGQAPAGMLQNASGYPIPVKGG